MMQLNEYPEAIAQLERTQLQQIRQVRDLKNSLAEMDANIKYTVAFDLDLKNDRQRDAQTSELKASPGYQSLILELQEAQDRQVELEIELELLRNQFTVAKLEIRERIAQMELTGRSL